MTVAIAFVAGLMVGASSWLLLAAWFEARRRSYWWRDRQGWHRR